MTVEDILSTAIRHSSSWQAGFGQGPLSLMYMVAAGRGTDHPRLIYRYLVGRDDVLPKKEISLVFRQREDVDTLEQMEKQVRRWQDGGEFQRIIEISREWLPPRAGMWRISLDLDGKRNKAYIVDISLNRYGGCFSRMDMGLRMIPLDTLQPVLSSTNSPRVIVVADAEGEYWVFKPSTDPGDDAFVAEVSFMLSLPVSPYAIRPSAGVVEEHEQEERLVGFLTPLQPASSIALVYRAKEVCTLRECPSCDISWRKRLAWAIDASAGLRWLHRLGHAWGDMKMDNLVLCQDDKLRLIDYAPGGKTPGWIAPELEAEALSDAKTMAGDVFSLGLVLWCLAEEVPEVEDGFLVGEGRWTQTNPAVPGWYKGLVNSCLARSPEGRPTADEVCDILETHVGDVL
ncbi:kinase-like protein [Hymenopellis radicata]|nr:kinase-like protein [Hymenopellis radicata]